jgi:hypothetical protein
MSLAIVHSRAQEGVAAPAVTVEVHLSGGLPGTSIVGLPETAVKEARDRVRVAIQNAQLDYPSRRVTVSLAPADLPKDGGRFDLPIALGILAAAGQLPKEALGQYEFLGELALSGELRPVTGVLPAALKAVRAGRTLIVPQANGAEAALIGAAEVRSATSLLDVMAFLRGVGELPPAAVPALDATCAASCTHAARSRSQRPGGTTCCSVVRRAPARRCLPAACPGSCRRWATPRRSNRRRCVQSPASPSISTSGKRDNFVRRTTPRRQSRWLAAVRSRGRARFRSRTTASCFSTNSPNSIVTCSKCCASRSKADAS